LDLQTYTFKLPRLDRQEFKMPIDEEAATKVAELFSTLSDPSRARIISALLESEEMHVGALAECLEMSESAVSHQLRGLRQMKLVRARREGRQMFYSLEDEHVADLFEQGIEHIRHG
jgi:DNA-binding transcriptional ArsR family regulator